jgi:condensin complex subunit 1
MIHKVWDKQSDAEAGSVSDHLTKCFSLLYMEPGGEEANPALFIAGNLIKLTQTMNLAELTSLEQLLGSYEEYFAEQGVIECLFTLFTSKRNPAFRLGATIVLSMICTRDIVEDHFDLLLGGLDSLHLGKYVCLCFQKLVPSKRAKGSLGVASSRLPPAHPLFKRLMDLLLYESPADPANTFQGQWFAFANEAIHTIYLLSEHPDALCGELVRRLTLRAFRRTAQAAERATASMEGVVLAPLDQAEASERPASPAEDGMEVDGAMVPLVDGSSGSAEAPDLSASAETNTNTSSNATTTARLAKLAFAVGHVAVKQIVHLENVESEWKRRKHLLDAAAQAVGGRRGGGEGTPLDQVTEVTGTAEDEFAEAIAMIKERELLYGERSLLALYGPLLSHLCMHSARLYPDPTLQIMVTVALCKFMCVSAEFCESHLPLLLNVLGKSTDSIVRSNLVIGLGDMAVSFNSLIDEHISHLYQRLGDADRRVKKNALMVLTFLILNGMVKVKGQIAEMAKCIQDPDPGIADLAKLFFTELSTKDNAVYNNLPDMISTLSERAEEPDFRVIMKFLLDFIKKDRQADALVEK